LSGGEEEGIRWEEGKYVFYTADKWALTIIESTILDLKNPEN